MEPEATAVPLAQKVYYDRAGTQVDKIVLHNTEAHLFSALEILSGKSANNTGRASIHRVAARSGDMYSLVDESLGAWHCGTKACNLSSVGMEIEAYAGAPGMTPEQQAIVIAQVQVWMARYSLTKDDVHTHRTFYNTDCPLHLWPSEDAFSAWKDQHL